MLEAKIIQLGIYYVSNVESLIVTLHEVFKCGLFMDENDIPVQEDAVSEEMERNSIVQENSDEQVGEGDDSPKIPIKENKNETQHSNDIQELDSCSSVAVEQVEDQEPFSPDFDFFYVERYPPCKSPPVPTQQLEDVEQLSQDTLDTDKYDEYESSSHPEDKRNVSFSEKSEAYQGQKDPSFEEQSDIGLEQQYSVILEEQSDVGLEEQSVTDLEQHSDIDLKVQSETSLEEESDIELEEQSNVGLEEQSNIDLEEDICFDEQSYLSSREEKSDSEKIEERRKSSLVTKPDRQKLIEIYQTLQCEESVLLKQNYELQVKLAARLKSLEKQEYVSIPDKADIEEKYHFLLGEIEDMWKTDAEQLERHAREKKELKLLLAQKQQKLTQMKDDLFSKQKRATLMAISTQTGRHICPEEIEMYLNRILATDEEVNEARRKYVKEKRRLQKLQNFAIEKDTSPGSENVDFLQYEELRIASETNQMQLEKLAEEKRKVDGVFSTYVQMISHTMEKVLDLECITAGDEQSLDDEITSKTEQLAHLKQKKNKSAERLERLRNHFGILNDQNLMRYYDKLQHDLHGLRIKITGIKSELNEDNTK